MPRPYNPKGRSTDAVIEARVDQLIQVLAARPQSRKSELRRTFTQEWGVHWRTVDRFVSRAREEIIKRLGRTKEEFRAESLSFYERVASDPKASHSDKLYARKLVDDLLGTWAPKQHRLGDPDGKPLQTVIAPVVEFIIPDNGRGGPVRQPAKAESAGPVEAVETSVTGEQSADQSAAEA